MADGKSTRWPRGAGRDPEKTKATQRRNYLKHADKKRAKQRRYMRELPPEVAKAAKRRMRVAQRAKYVGNGLTIKGQVRKRDPRKANNTLWERNAKQAWAWWLKTCPDWWLRAYHRAKGKPWNNPRLSNAKRWRIRYWLDPVFRAREIEKVQRLKIKRAERIAATEDGTLTGAVIVDLFSKTKACHYCSKPMRSVEKSIDHVIPLCAGGAHSLHNVVIACKPCNFAKGKRVSI